MTSPGFIAVGSPAGSDARGTPGYRPLDGDLTMSLSRWKIMAGALGVSLGGFAAIAGQCPKPDTNKTAGRTVALPNSNDGPSAAPLLPLPASSLPESKVIPALPTPEAASSSPDTVSSKTLPPLPVPSSTSPVIPLAGAEVKSPPITSESSRPDLPKPLGSEASLPEFPRPTAAPNPPETVYDPQPPIPTPIPGTSKPTPPAEPPARVAEVPPTRVADVPPTRPTLPPPPAPPVTESTNLPMVPPASTASPEPMSVPASPPSVPVEVVKPVPASEAVIDAVPAVVKPAVVKPAPVATVPAVAVTPSHKYRILLRVGEGEPNFEVRCGDELVLKVACEKVDIKSPEKGNGPSAVRASGRVRFVGFGSEGTCDELSFLAGTGEVSMTGNVKIQVKDKFGRIESELSTDAMKYRIDPCLSTGPRP
jgi:hypothetical protein